MTPESIPSMAITSFPASLKGKYQYDRAGIKTQEKRIKTARTTAGREVRGMGIVGPMGVYGAANDTDLTQHLVAELRKAMDAKSAAQRDANGNRYVPVDYFVVWQTVELLERRLLPTDQQPDKGITEIT